MKKFLTSLTAIIILVVAYITLDSNIESLARVQNSFNLRSVNSCVNGTLKIKTSDELSKSLDICGKNVRSLGVTGDIFVMRNKDKNLFWDSSVDCKIDSSDKLYMTKESVCALFKDPESCVLAVDKMMSLSSNLEGTTWLFDDDIEYVDYKYIKDAEGVKINIDDSNYIIAQGTQRDEVLGFFNTTIIVLIIGCSIVIFIMNY